MYPMLSTSDIANEMTKIFIAVWNWICNSDKLIQILLCVAVCCCLTCLLICCKKCCCYNTCNRKRKRSPKIIIQIKEPERPIPQRKPSKEGKLSSKLKGNENIQNDMNDS